MQLCAVVCIIQLSGWVCIQLYSRVGSCALYYAALCTVHYSIQLCRWVCSCARQIEALLHPSEDSPSQVHRFLRFPYPSLVFHGEVCRSQWVSQVSTCLLTLCIFFEQMVSGLLHLSSQFLLRFPSSARVSFRLEFHSWLSLAGVNMFVDPYGICE